MAQGRSAEYYGAEKGVLVLRLAHIDQLQGGLTYS
jgi:hypothetical protein